VKYLNFFRYSHWWQDTFSNIKDEKIDLSYLDEKKLFYPILGIGINNRLTFFIPEALLNTTDKDVIKKRYNSKDFEIVKYKNFYIVVLKERYNLPYFKITKYISILKKILNEDLKIITFQI
jgi:hypothetical protein